MFFRWLIWNLPFMVNVGLDETHVIELTAQIDSPIQSLI
jgi:hypothetical protein